MRRHAASSAILVGVVLVHCGSAASRAQSPDELEVHLAELQSQVDDPNLKIEKRQQIAMEMVATLDRAAQAAPTAEGRRAHWAEAVRRLDQFRERNPEMPQSDAFPFQAAVYLWAQARSWSQQWELAPTDHAVRDHAIADLDAVLARLRPMGETLCGSSEVFAQNVRFRLAESLADRAEFEPKDAESRRVRELEALQFLEPIPSEPELQGFARLLRGELLGRLGKADQALAEIDAAAKATPAPPATDVLEARVAVLIRSGRFDNALKAVASGHVDEVTQSWLAIRVRLAQRASRPPGGARTAIDSAVFAQVKVLRKSGRPEARLALIALARGLSEPDTSQEPDAWDAVAEGALTLGDLARAGALEVKGAARAEALGKPDQAAALRLRAGALLFQAERFLEADALLSRVADDPRAGSLRPRAGLLRALGRGRAVALRLPGASPHAYAQALEAQIRDFPSDPSTSEARWLLGRLRLAASDRVAAQALWTGIPRNDPRWLDAQLTVASLRQDDLDTQRINNDRERVIQRYKEARDFLSAILDQVQSDSERVAVQLGLARLDLTPEVGHPDEARQTCERVLRSAGQPEQRDQARRLKILALAELGRFIEAEQAARAEVNQARPADLIHTVRLLDQVASESESDLRLRRFGLILRILLARILERPEELSREQRWEAQLRQTRALLFSGDEARARTSLAEWGATTPPFPSSDRLLRDLADTYARLDVFELAVDVQRLRMQRNPTGSLPWFAARYGLALAYYHSGRAKDARQLIDATTILHPDLGGGDLREKFVRLRQRLDPEE